METLKKKLKHWPLLVTKGTWPWRLEEKLVLSRLYYAARKERGLGPSQLSNEIGLDYKTVVAALEKLATAELVCFENGKWHGSEPDDRHPYLVPGKPSKHWASALVCFPFFVPVEKRNLRAAAMFSLLADLCRQHCGVVRKVTPAYLAVLLAVSDKSAAKYLGQLQEAGLIESFANGDRIDVKCCLENLSWFDAQQVVSASGATQAEKPKPTVVRQAAGQSDLPTNASVQSSSASEAQVSYRSKNPTSQRMFEFLKELQIPIEMARNLTNRWVRLRMDVEPFTVACEQRHNIATSNYASSKSRVPHAGFLIRKFLEDCETIKANTFVYEPPHADDVLGPATARLLASVLNVRWGIPKEEAESYAKRVEEAGCNLDEVCSQISGTPFFHRKRNEISIEQHAARIDELIQGQACAV